MKKLLFLSTLIFVGFLFSSYKKNSTNVASESTLDKLNTVYDLVFGGSGNDDDEYVSGMVMDKSGNIYFSMNVTTPDANKNIIYAKVNSDGTLGWAKVFDEGEERSPDSGENGETGGTAGSISIDSDGYIYIVGYSKTSEQGQALLILKINPDDGSLVWQKKWKPEWPNKLKKSIPTNKVKVPKIKKGFNTSSPSSTPTANQNAVGYAIDAHGDYVYVTGESGNTVVVVALDKEKGNLYFQKALDIVHGTKDRGYAIYQNGSNLFVGGVDGSYAWFGKISNATSKSPKLEFVKKTGLPYGSRINQILSDGNDIFFSCDVRGASTKFMVMKSDIDGNFVWAKSYGTRSDLNNTHVIYLDGDNIYAGGRIELAGRFSMGDAGILKMSKTDGSLQWAKIYSTGTMNYEAAEQRVKGIAVNGDKVIIVGQIYPNDANTEHYQGTFITPKTPFSLRDESIGFGDMPNVSFNNFNGDVRDAGGTIADYTVGKLLNSKDKVASNPPDCDAFIIKFQP